MNSVKIETELNKARQQLADLQAVVQTSEDSIVQLDAVLSESLAGVPVDKLDAAALKQADTRLKLEAESLKLGELQRRAYAAQENVTRLTSEWRQAKGREMAQAAYADAEEVAEMLRAVMPRLRANFDRYEAINTYYAGYQQSFSGNLVRSLEDQLATFDKEASSRTIS